MNWLIFLVIISMLASYAIVLRRAYLVRTFGVVSRGRNDNTVFSIAYVRFSKLLDRLASDIIIYLKPYVGKLLNVFMSLSHFVASSLAFYLTRLSNFIEGKGSFHKNRGHTSLFIRDVSRYRDDIV